MWQTTTRCVTVYFASVRKFPHQWRRAGLPVLRNRVVECPAWISFDSFVNYSYCRARLIVIWQHCVQRVVLLYTASERHPQSGNLCDTHNALDRVDEGTEYLFHSIEAEPVRERTKKWLSITVPCAQSVNPEQVSSSVRAPQHWDSQQAWAAFCWHSSSFAGTILQYGQKEENATRTGRQATWWCKRKRSSSTFESESPKNYYNDSPVRRVAAQCLRSLPPKSEVHNVRQRVCQLTWCSNAEKSTLYDSDFNSADGREMAFLLPRTGKRLLFVTENCGLTGPGKVSGWLAIIISMSTTIAPWTVVVQLAWCEHLGSWYGNGWCWVGMTSWIERNLLDSCWLKLCHLSLRIQMRAAIENVH